MVKEEEFIFENKIYKIKIGQNKQDNWDLIDASQLNDIWFHTSDYPSSHIVLENIDNMTISGFPKQVIKRCACICKANSKAKAEKNVDIIYTPIYSIKKTNIVGQVTTPTNVKRVCV